MPYLTIYCASRGLSRLEIGILMSLFALVTMFGAPFWTEIADATGRIGRYGYRSSGSCWPPPAASRATHMVPLALFTVLLAFHLAPAMPLLEPAVLEALGDRAHAYGRWRVRGGSRLGCRGACGGLGDERLPPPLGLLPVSRVHAVGRARCRPRALRREHRDAPDRGRVIGRQVGIGGGRPTAHDAGPFHLWSAAKPSTACSSRPRTPRRCRRERAPCRSRTRWRTRSPVAAQAS